MIDWTAIERFIGYGNPDAAVVFIGMEEGLQRDADLDADLATRSSYGPFMDLAKAQAELDGPGAYFGDSPITQKTWRPMCHLMLKRAGVAHPSRVDRLRYQADRLGRIGDETLLTELLPLPHSDSRQWLYAHLCEFASREEYMEKVTPERQRRLAALFREHHPEIVVAYGKEYWETFKGIFPGAEWTPVGAFEYAQVGATRVVLTHAFSGRQFNTDDQLDAFAEIALGGRSSPAPQETTPPDLTQGIHNSDLRKIFGALVRSYRSVSGLSRDAVSRKASEHAGQGNVGGVVNLENGSGWVASAFAEGVFIAVGVPDADAIARAYAALRAAVGGRTKETD